MNDQLSFSSKVMQGILMLFDVNASLAKGIPNALVMGGEHMAEMPPDLTDMVKSAVDEFDKYCAHESRELGEADRAAVEEWLLFRMGELDPVEACVTAVRGRDEFKQLVMVEDDLKGWGTDVVSYVSALVRLVRDVMEEFAQSPEMLGVVSVVIVRALQQELNAKPPKTQVQKMTGAAIDEVGNTRRANDGVSQLANIARRHKITTDNDTENAAALVACLNSDDEDRLVVFDNVENTNDLHDLIPCGTRIRTLLTTTKKDAAISPHIKVGTFSEPQARQYLLDLVKTKNPDTESAAKAARGIVGALLFLDETGVPRSWIQEMTSESDPFRSDRNRRALELLLSHSVLVKSEDESMISIHRLQARVVREYFTDDQTELAIQTAISILNEGLSQSEGGEYSKKRIHIAKLGTQLRAIQTQKHSTPLRTNPELLELVGSTIHNAVDLRDSRTAISLESYLQQFESHNGRDHPETLTTRNNLAVAYRSVGDYERAIEMFGEVLEVQSGVLGPDHPNTLITRHNLAMAYRGVGDYERAIEMYMEVLEVEVRVLGSDHPETLTTCNNLAGAYHGVGDYGRAIEMFKGVLEVETRVLGSDHSSTLTTRNNLAVVYGGVGDYGRAIEMFKGVLEVQSRVLGPNHPDTLTTRNNLAVAYHNSNRPGSIDAGGDD